jgi:hypothetical protein
MQGKGEIGTGTKLNQQLQFSSKTRWGDTLFQSVVKVLESVEEDDTNGSKRRQASHWQILGCQKILQR